jgi:hypothetical protein
MVNVSSALSQLRAERSKVEQELSNIDEAITVLERLSGRAASHVAHNKSSRGNRVISAASRRKMALAQQARWAKFRAAKKDSDGEKVSVPQRTVSLATRKKLAAAQKARWARQRQAA